ncbi:MAG: SusD/RagB family nutrient-binding outer membrane lipoprotein [Bacteroidetes bacterium]|jgi:hypothetical protein|nr:SusD/RagB family nutrient-binding outer membrane lipoprotein [Bacteroidota bacterium]MBT3750554.1 SusD/RagB family nutrient-binding outer membrane lipoprotein [Bacteroidota bacterium]MBT4408922.1 SusD/RagB family nutrient-binding outer membrane lipoprotein [Bacteroidota bacterium]MBT7465138.1 SusD/RagB family nutrient-binding outer membrane lipoprotein [Bacteroidota bacterium]
MKRKLYIVLVMFAGLAVIFNSCNKSELEDLYTDPGKSTVATVENFFTGVLMSANNVVLPWYWRFFVVEQPTLGHFTQVMGWMNTADQYLVSETVTKWRWEQYYNGPMTKFRVMELLYNDLEETDQADMRVFMLAAKIFFYDQSQQMVDLFGDIPWSEAGKVRELGDLDAALPKYDTGKEIYDAMLADLESINNELASLKVKSFYAGLFADKDLLNNGDVTLWRKYANSLSLRLLMRMSDAVDVSAKVAAILNDPGKYPIVENNGENIMLDAGGPDLYATTSSMNGGIRQAMETWGQYDIAPKALCDFMVNNTDPRLEITFDPNINGEYNGMDPLIDGTTQSNMLADGLIARYDTSSFTRNNYFPGFVIGAAEISLIKAEAFEKGFATGDAKSAYNLGVEQSIEFYYAINATGDYREPIAMDAAAVAAYLLAPGVAWDGNDKMEMIATQKWINSGLGSMTQTWSELRRFDLPVFDFLPDNATASGQSLPPMRWLYPSSEKALNESNYNEVVGTQDMDNKIFWDKN